MFAGAQMLQLQHVACVHRLATGPRKAVLDWPLGHVRRRARVPRLPPAREARRSEQTQGEVGRVQGGLDCGAQFLHVNL